MSCRDIMQDRLEPESGKHLPAFFEMVDTAQILPMVARTTIHAINSNDPSLFRKSLSSISSNCNPLFTTALRRLPPIPT